MMRFDLFVDSTWNRHLNAPSQEVLLEGIVKCMTHPFLYRMADKSQEYLCCDLDGHHDFVKLRSPDPARRLAVFGFPFEFAARDGVNTRDCGFFASLTRSIRVNLDERTVRIDGQPSLLNRLLDNLSAALREPRPSVDTSSKAARVLDTGDCDYRRRFNRLGRFFADGEFYQLVLSRTTRYAVQQAPLALYLASRVQYADAHYSYYFSLPEVTVFGNCSLPHLEANATSLMTRVFAGTYPRGQSVRREDFFAEHAMLVDLERNDFAKIGVLGSVQVSDLMSSIDVGATRYVQTTIQAKRRPVADYYRELVGLAPRGVVTGAPKSSAVTEILQTSQRGWYSGVIGFIDYSSGQVRSNVIVSCAISTVRGEFDVPVASGVLHDSDVERELGELNLKRRLLEKVMLAS